MSSSKHWTEEQLKAINSIGNVIVSAGAGSGKTAVLTQRIIHNIENQTITNLNQILILTFTNNAAAEMRERIKNELNNSSNLNLKKLVPLIDSANICTFDAYALMLVKKYSHVLKLSPDIKIASDDIIETKKFELLDKILNNLYKSKDWRIAKLITNYCNRVEELTNWIFQIADIIANENDYDEYIKKYYQKYLSDEAIQYFIDNVLFKILKQKIDKLSNKMVEDDIKKNKFPFVKKKEEYFNFSSFYELIDKWNEVTEWRELFLNANKRRPKSNDDFKNIFDETKGYNFFGLNKDIEQNRELIPFVIKLAFKLNEEIKYFKQSKGVYTFSDIASIATKLLVENDDIRESIKNNLKIIMIDEYQDTSTLQENFINLIANNNVFVVGDVKQSIYGFREANPQQFINKCGLYKSNPDKGTFIDMCKNFRSRKEVINDINNIFNMVMTKQCGGVNYYEEGQIEYPENSPYSNDKSNLKQKYGISKMDIEVSNDKGYKDKLKIIKTIAYDIINKVNNKEQIYDRNLKANRYCTFKDFAILIPKKNNFKLFEKVFIECGIPINADYPQLVKEDDSTIILINLLSIVDTLITKQVNQLSKKELIQLKHWFISIARSFIGNYDDQKIYELVGNNSDNWIHDSLFIKINEFAIRHNLSCISDIYLDLINEFNFIKKLSLIKNENVLNKLNINNVFYKKIIEMDELGYTLKSFIAFLNHLDELDIEIESPKISTSENAVVLTTIHKSKGLEYGIVYLPFVKDKMKQENKSSFFADKEYGFWLPSLHAVSQKTQTINNNSLHKQFYKYYASYNAERDSETLRLLYVALTRAREQLIVINEIIIKKENSKKGSSEDSSSTDLDEKQNKSIGDFIDQSQFFNENESKNFIEIDNPTKLNINHNQETNNDKQLIVNEFNYTFNKLKKIRKASSYVSGDVDKNILKSGTHYHLLMEYIDFKNKDTSIIKDLTERKIIDKVLANDIFKNINEAKVYQEYSFYDDIEKTVGIIDLLIEYDDYIDIIDYKLSNITDADNKYQEQLKVYADYVSRTFNKKVNTYLLSIIKNEIKKVN